MENYFIIHGSFGSPFGNWFSWLQDFIATDSKQVYVPDFPIGVGYQNYENWSKLLKYYLDLGLINESTTIIGHSIAPIFISKFLVENKVKVKKLIFVCGFNNYLGINEEYDSTPTPSNNGMHICVCPKHTNCSGSYNRFLQNLLSMVYFLLFINISFSIIILSVVLNPIVIKS